VAGVFCEEVKTDERVKRGTAVVFEIILIVSANLYFFFITAISFTKTLIFSSSSGIPIYKISSKFLITLIFGNLQ
jgi:hypothetical protein